VTPPRRPRDRATARSPLDAPLARRIALVAFDVDGVFTDGSVYLGLVANHPLEFKRFSVQDGLGVRLLRAAGLAVVLVSSRPSEASEARAQELEVEALLQVGPGEKLSALTAELRRRNVPLAACAYVGDDLTDLAPLGAVGLPIAVANAVAEAKAAARLVTSAPGGQGAVREVAELLLKARGEWAGLLARYAEARDGEVRDGAQRRSGSR
jgi:3-deoxy-D-manno-octulosonate 8-phosphate phosphatase (KDO 8-P phosphatase)